MADVTCTIWLGPSILARTKPNQTSPQQIDEKVFDVVLVDLHVLLDFREGDFALRLGQLHEGEDAHFAEVGLVVQSQLVDELAVVVVKLLVALQPLRHEDLEQVVDQLLLQELDGRQLQQTVQQEGLRIG